METKEIRWERANDILNIIIEFGRTLNLRDLKLTLTSNVPTAIYMYVILETQNVQGYPIKFKPKTTNKWI